MNGRKRPVILFILLLMLRAILPLGAQNFQLVSFLDYYGGIEPGREYENLRMRFFARPRFGGFNESLNFEWLLSASLWADPLADPGLIAPRDILHEAYLFFPFSNFDITLGQKVVAYGFSDIFGPLNVLTSTNRVLLSLDDGFDTRKPDPLVQIRVYPGFLDTVELTYVPLTRPDRERPDTVFLPGSRDSVVWTDDPYLYENPHSFFLNYSHYGEKADLQLFYGWYTDHTPDFRIETIDSSTDSVITTVYNKKHTFGAAYSTGLGSTTLSQDFAFNLTEDLDGRDMGARNSDMTVNTQLLANLPGNILGQFSLVYSYFINHGNPDPGSDPAAGEYLAEEIQNFHTQPLEHIAFIVAHFERSFLREKLKIQLNAGYFFSPKIYLAPRLAYSLTDYWTVETGGDINLGSPPDFDLRRNPGNDNFYVRILYRY